MLHLTPIMWPARKDLLVLEEQRFSYFFFSILCVVFFARFWQHLFTAGFTVTVWDLDVSQTSAILPFSLLSHVPECSQIAARIKQHVSSCRVILSINSWPKQNKQKKKVQPVLIQWRMCSPLQWYSLSECVIQVSGDDWPRSWTGIELGIVHLLMHWLTAFSPGDVQEHGID